MKISTSNHMFERAIWDKLAECIFENSGNFKICENHEYGLPQNCSEPKHVISR